MTLGGGAVDAIVKGIGEVQWLADGLTLAGKMLPALGFAILLRLFTSQKKSSLPCSWICRYSYVDNYLH
mgnify:CR=1 FL=1